MNGQCSRLQCGAAIWSNTPYDLIVSWATVAQGGGPAARMRRAVARARLPVSLRELDRFPDPDFSATSRSRTRSERKRLLRLARGLREQLGGTGSSSSAASDRGRVERILGCHATAASNEGFDPHVHRPDDEVESASRVFVGAAAVAAGHVHLQWLRRFDTTTLVLRSGSVRPRLRATTSPRYRSVSPLERCTRSSHQIVVGRVPP